MNTPNRNAQAQYLPVNLAMQHFNLSRGLLMNLATDAQALVRYGNVIRIDTRKIETYLDEHCTGNRE